MTHPRADRSPEAQAFGAILNDALQGHPHIHLAPYRVPAPIVYTPPQTEAQMREALQFDQDA